MTKSPKYPLLLLDLDGTLVDSFADIEASVAAAMRAIGLGEGLELTPLVRRGAPLEELYHHATGRDAAHAAEAERLRAFGSAYRDHYLPRCLDNTRAFPEVAATLATLRALPAPPVIGIATAKRSETARRVLEGCGLLGLVDVVAGSEGIKSKPDPAVLFRAAELAGRDIRTALMVGDTVRDVEAARAAGCAAAAITHDGVGETELRESQPDYLLPTFASLVDVVTGGGAGAGGAG
jgi:phosphoglycolate phosphatase-like HAD superfamily hydrolase